MKALEPATSIPVIAEVDVVVIGGASGGVAAAVEATRCGASVFLAAPRPYLGEDICATLRYWLEPEEQPQTELARELFAAETDEPTDRNNRIAFSVATDREPSPVLADATRTGFPADSVQYDGDVTLLLDLGSAQNISRVSVMAYQKAWDCELEEVLVAVSEDLREWRSVGEIQNNRIYDGDFVGSPLILTVQLSATARFVKLEIRKTARARRLLVGDIVVEGAAHPANGPDRGHATASQLPTPMHVKRTLDQALLKAKVPFLYECLATDVLRDADGHPAGVVIMSVSGQQAILAKVITDVTERSAVARWSGARFTTCPVGERLFRRVVIGGSEHTGEKIYPVAHSEPLYVIDDKDRKLPVREYEMRLAMRSGEFSGFADAEQQARDLTWTAESVASSEVLWEVPPDRFLGRETFIGSWPGTNEIPLGCFRPDGVDYVLALGGCASVSREAAARLIRPVNLITLGERLGSLAAAIAKERSPLKGVHRAGAVAANALPGAVHTLAANGGHRTAGRSISAETRGLPVLGTYDVVVVGAGTGGAPAALAASRLGAKTLLIEYLHVLGGMGTAGMVSMYYKGNRSGFTKEIDLGVSEFGAAVENQPKEGWISFVKAEWYRQELRKAGADIWYGTLGAGALVAGGRVQGVVAATPQGLAVVLAKVVIDSTGSAAVAAAAGAETAYRPESEIALQGTGLPPGFLTPHYFNTDYTYVDETDVFDIWRALVVGREKYKASYDLGQLIGTRERRRVIGDIELKPSDVALGRTWHDTIVIANSDFDSHGYTVDPLLLLRAPDRTDIHLAIPYRCLLPRGLDGILVTGLGISLHRDTLPLARMQADIQNQGYAAGVAAAMLAASGKPSRELDIRALQQHLVRKGALPESVLSDVDAPGLPEERLVRAVARVIDNYHDVEVLMAEPERALPLLRDAFVNAGAAETQLIYAHILAMLGDKTGAGVLIEHIERSPWDEGWRFRTMGQFGGSLSPLDSLIIALGRSKEKRGVPAVITKLRQLTPSSEFSHFRAVTLALEELRDRRSLRPLAELLDMPGVAGHSLTSIDAALAAIPPGSSNNAFRSRELIEIGLARALYRCGDCDGRAEQILRQYANDLRGHYARHARAILAKPAGK